MHFALASLVLFAATACVTTTSSRSLRSEFEDIPVPKGLNYVESQSVVIESPSVKAARMLYRGRIEVTSLATALRTTLEANGWRAVSNTSGASNGTTQVYEKAGNSLQVRVWEGWYYTYVEMTASRALQGGPTATK
jgi:hypothetical protein